MLSASSLELAVAQSHEFLLALVFLDFKHCLLLPELSFLLGLRAAQFAVGTFFEIEKQVVDAHNREQDIDGVCPPCFIPGGEDVNLERRLLFLPGGEVVSPHSECIYPFSEFCVFLGARRLPGAPLLVEALEAV